jgi:hypothetical protein
VSETEHEDTEAPPPTPEPLEDDEAAEEEERASRDEEEPETPAEEPAPPEPEGLTEKQMEATRKKLDAENTRHRSRISDLIGEEALMLEPCPLCNGFADGYRFPVVPPDDVIEATRVAIGMPDLSNYQPAKNAHQCSDCAGLGVVLSGSLVPENAAITCKNCNGSGYVVVPGEGMASVAPSLTNGAQLQELPPGVNPDDPAVKELRARGYSVFPPVQLGVGT